MKKVCAIVSAAVLALSLSACSKKAASDGLTLEKGVLKIGMEIGYPPMEYYDTDGKTPIGFDVELGKAVAAKLGLEAQFVDTAWDGIFAGVDTDKYDCIMSSVTITEDRQKTLNFSKPYIGNGQALIITKSSKVSPKTPDDLTGLRVGYQAETTSNIFMDKMAAKGLKFEPEEYDKVMNAYDDLKLGRCDAVVSDALVAASYLSKPDTEYVMVWQGPADEFFGVSLKKGNDKLTEAVNKAIDELYADGSLKTISQKIFGADLVSTVNNK
jgi:polar amino acid transport system substrate-binding protein